MAALVQGTMIGGRYRLDALLGEGGMGTVWSATHSVTGGRVALKFVKGGVHEDARRRLLREARVATLVEHPNVVSIRDVFDHDDTPVIVMDLLHGETLAERLTREGIISLAEAARIGVSIIAAAGAAHEVGLIHRDLKPENVFLHQSGSGAEVVRVVDFGIAKLVLPDPDDAPESNVTRSGALIGTPAYMAPEQLFGERDLDHRVDVWAIGVMLHEMLAGMRPIDGDNLGQIAKRLLSEPIPSLAERAPDVPADVVEIVDRMVTRDRADRLDNLIEAAEVLARHGAAKRPSFGPPRQRSIFDSNESGRRVAASTPRISTPRADPMAVTERFSAEPKRSDARTEVSGSGPRSRPKSDTGIEHVTASRPTPRTRTRAPWILGALALVGAGALLARTVRWGETSPSTVPASRSASTSPSESASASPSASGLASASPSATALTSASATASPSVSASAPASTSLALGVLHPPPIPWKTPTVASATPSASHLPPTVASVAPPVPSATTTSTPGLVTKPPF